MLVLGDTVREIEVIVQPDRLLANHVTLDQVEEAIRKANTIQAVGRLNKDYKQFLVLISTEIPNIQALQKIVVSPGQASAADVREIGHPTLQTAKENPLQQIQHKVGANDPEGRQLEDAPTDERPPEHKKVKDADRTPGEEIPVGRVHVVQGKGRGLPVVPG